MYNVVLTGAFGAVKGKLTIEHKEICPPTAVIVNDDCWVYYKSDEQDGKTYHYYQGVSAHVVKEYVP